MRGRDSHRKLGGSQVGRRLVGRTVAAFRRPLIAAPILVIVLLAASAIGALASGGAPTVETEHVSGLGRTSVVLNAQVNPNGSAVSECFFEYGTSESSLSGTAPCSYSPGEGETPVPVTATVEGLPETTPYFFRIHAKSAAGESSGGVRQFTTLPTAPIANTESPSAVGHTTATFSAFVTPDDAEVTECLFEYGTVPGELNKSVACSPAPGAGSEPVAVHGSVSGLTESTVYYYRVVARNSFALEHGGRANFETLPAAPKANTEPAASIAHTSATLRGFVTPNGAAVEACFFEWGISSVEEHSAPCEQTELGSGEAPVGVSAQLSGLAESQTYHFRLVASNLHGTGVGGGTAFTTLPYVPKALIQKPGELSDESALLKAKVDPQGETITECTFEYGTTPALGKKTSCSTLPGAGEKFVQISATATGLSATTTYLVRLKAVDSSGTTYTKEEAFTTFKVGLLPIVTKLKPPKGSSTGGNAVTITGQNLAHAISVTFGETETTSITADSPDSLTVTAPPGVGTVDVVVTTENGESKTSSGDHYTYGKPTITAVSPNHGPTTGGSEVTVSGSGFEPGSSGTTFAFGKNQASSVECTSSSSCTMNTPASFKGKKGTVKVQAKVNGKGSSAAPAATFIYEA
jgi:IPT/TIG domain